MKQFKFNHNDYVTVVLTEDGAKHLSKERKEFYDRFPHLRKTLIARESWNEGDLYCAPFWELVEDFHELIGIGRTAPFEGGELKVESSYSPTES